jgi:hypothetical protein
MQRPGDTHGLLIGYLLWLCTGGLLLVGVAYDFWTLNDQVTMRNAAARQG